MAFSTALPSATQPQLKIDKQIFEIDKVICRNIVAIAFFSRGAVSQNVLAQLRNFVEHIMLRYYANGQDSDDTCENLCKGIDYVNTRGNLKVLHKFHDFLQIVLVDTVLKEEHMEKFIPYEKLSKKEKQKLDQAKRQT